MFNFFHSLDNLPNAYSWAYTPQPLVQPGEICVPEQAKYKRTWTTLSIQTLVAECETYCQYVGKNTESLTLADFQFIAQRLPQTPQQCFTKFREVQATGTMKPGVWCREEEDLLMFLMKDGRYKWAQIAKAINSEFHNQVKVRSGKQCKEKWFNHLNPDVERGPWTTQEDLAILKAHRQFGNKWSQVARAVSNRIESGVKNRVKSLINKEKQQLRGQEAEGSLVEILIQKLQEKLT